MRCLNRIFSSLFTSSESLGFFFNKKLFYFVVTGKIFRLLNGFILNFTLKNFYLKNYSKRSKISILYSFMLNVPRGIKINFEF